MNGERADSLSVKDIGVRRGEGRVHLRIAVHNDSDRTLHAYATARRIEYDRDTRKLQVELSDENREPPPAGSVFVQPKFVAVDAEGDRTIELDLPEVLHRIGPESDQTSLAFEALPIHEATSVAVKVAWGETPFYPDVREPRRSPLQQLNEWREGTVRGEVEIEPPATGG
jgi:hypothetical protein